MGRRLVIFGILGLGLLLAALVALRTAAVEALIANRLAARGVAVAAISVTEVGLNGLRIDELRLGKADEFSARALRIAYRPAALLRGEVARVAIEGLTLKLDLTAATPFGSLQPLLTANGGAPPATLPTVEVEDGRIEAEIPLGPVTAELDGELWPEDAGEIAGAFAFALTASHGRLTGAFDLARAPAGVVTGNLVVEDGALALPGAEVVGLLGEARYALIPGQPPELDAWLSAESVTLPGAALDEAQITVKAAQNDAKIAARVAGDAGRWSLALDAGLDDYLGAPAVRFDARAEAGAGAALWPLLALPDPATGRVTLRAGGTGRLAPLTELVEGGALADWLSRAAVQGQASADATGLAYPGRAEAVSGALTLDLAFRDGVLGFKLPSPARLTLAGLAPDWLAGLGLPTPAVPLLAPGATLTLAAQGEAAPAGLSGPLSLVLETPDGTRLEGTSQVRLDFAEGLVADHLALDDLRLTARAVPLPGLRLRELDATGALAGDLPALAGDLDLRLAADDIALQDLRATAVQATLPVAFHAEPGSLALRLSAPGEVTLREAAYGESLRMPALRAALPEGRLGYADGALEHTVILAPAPGQIHLRRAAGDLVAELAPGAVRLEGTWTPDAPYRGTLHLDGSRVTLPGQNLVAEGVEANLALGPAPGRLVAELTLSALSHDAEPPLFAPLGGRLTARGDGETVAFEGQLADRGGAARLAVSGRHDLPRGQGEARLALDPLTFAPDGLQPGDLAPPLKDLRDVTGGLRAKAELAWTAEGLTGGADLAIADLSFDSEAAEVRGLDLGLALTSLMPPASAPGQSLTVRRIDPGVALDQVAVRFQIRPGVPLRLAVEEGQFRVSGGRVLLRDLLLDPAAPRLDLPLDVEGLDLAELFRILDIEGLSGSGRLSGRIPVALEAETVTITQGRLEAEAPGTLRFESAQARQALAAAGESADLMLRALQDFRYDELSLTIDKPAAAAARLTLVLLGHNPDVLDGYPFRFNINLEGDTDRLVAALRQAYSLSNRMLRQFWQPGR